MPSGAWGRPQMYVYVDPVSGDASFVGHSGYPVQSPPNLSKVVDPKGNVSYHDPVGVLDGAILPRADALKARSALLALRGLSRRADADLAREMRTTLERLEAGSHELAQLRLLHLALTGQVELSDTERAEVDRLTRPGEPAERLGLPPDTDASAQQAAALERLEHWRTKAAHPLTSRVGADAYGVLAESYEQLYAAASEA